MICISKDDLYKNQYTKDILKANIYSVSLLDILKTQKLDADFCVKYILNSDFQLTPEDQKIDMEFVKELQPHILKTDLVKYQIDALKKKKAKVRVDSFDFEEYSYCNKDN